MRRERERERGRGPVGGSRSRDIPEIEKHIDEGGQNRGRAESNDSLKHVQKEGRGDVQ